jgi:hypothetical protein
VTDEEASVGDVPDALGDMIGRCERATPPRV